VSAGETLEIYAFMAAAQTSKDEGGGPVNLESTALAAMDAAQDIVEAEWRRLTTTAAAAAESSGPSSGVPSVREFWDAARPVFKPLVPIRAANHS
jgi:hypothetical protein